MLPLFLAALANVIGLGVIVPLLPFYAGEAGASPAQVAWLFAVFSLAQFATAPLWGRLSDRVGRKPVIAISFGGSVLAYIWLAQADGLVAIFLARAFAGVMNGWLATSQAYIADTTTPERRARGMGMLGAAFGVGFVIGPALGGYLVGGGAPNFELPMMIAAAGSGVAFLIALAALREPARQQTAADAQTTLAQAIAGAPLVVGLIGFTFCVFFVFAGMESTFAVWTDAVLGMGPRDVGYYLSFAGICGTIVQAWLVGRMAAWIGEAKVLVLALIVLAGGLALLPAAETPPMLLPAIALLAFGFGLANPSLLSLISREAPGDLRGAAMGFNQSSASLGRILGPSWAGLAYGVLGPDWPFLSGALILIPVAVLAAVVVRRLTARA